MKGMNQQQKQLNFFETLLNEKGIEIPCKDKTEQKERYYDDNDAKLYGMEYYNLLADVQELL